MVKINIHAFWINFVGRNKKLIKTPYGNLISFNQNHSYPNKILYGQTALAS